MITRAKCGAMPTGRLRCNRSNGTIGLVVGAAGGALVGHAIDSRGDAPP